MQYACAISSEAYISLQNFSTLSQKRNVFRKKVIEYKMCVSSFYTNLSEIFFIVKRIERDMIKMYIGLHVKCPLFLSDFD